MLSSAVPVQVTDLSLVPGARLGTPMDAAAAAGQVRDSVSSSQVLPIAFKQ